jgi:hypothetical protein
MAKLFQDAKDVHVVATYIYGKGTDSYAYKDSACTTKFTTSELKNAFLKGAVIALASNGGYVFPVKYAESSSVGSVYFIKPNGTTATSADIASLAGVADPS